MMQNQLIVGVMGGGMAGREQDMFKRYLKTEMLFTVKTPGAVIAKKKYLFQ